MFILLVCAVFGILNILLFSLVVIGSADLFKRRYPDLKPQKSHWSVTVINLIKIILTSICPVVNICMTYVLIFHDDGIREKAVTRMYERCLREVSNDLS